MTLIIGCDGDLNTSSKGLDRYAFYSYSRCFVIENSLEEFESVNRIGFKAMYELLKVIGELNRDLEDVVIVTWGGPEKDSLEALNSIRNRLYKITVVDLQVKYTENHSYPALKKFYSKHYSSRDPLKLIDNSSGICGDAYRIYRIYCNQVEKIGIGYEYLLHGVYFVMSRSTVVITKSNLILYEVSKILDSHKVKPQCIFVLVTNGMKKGTIETTYKGVTLIIFTKSSELSNLVICSNVETIVSVCSLNNGIDSYINSSNVNFSLSKPNEELVFMNTVNILRDVYVGGSSLLSFGNIAEFNSKHYFNKEENHSVKATAFLSYSKDNKIEISGLLKNCLDNMINTELEIILTLDVKPHSKYTGVQLLKTLWGLDEKVHLSMNTPKGDFYNTESSTNLKSIVSKLVEVDSFYTLSAGISFSNVAVINLIITAIETIRLHKNISLNYNLI